MVPEQPGIKQPTSNTTITLPNLSFPFKVYMTEDTLLHIHIVSLGVQNSPIEATMAQD